MRWKNRWVLAAALTLPAVAASAAEQGAVIRAGELKARPAIDAPTAAKVAAKQNVSIIGRQGAWVQVDAGGGKTGWLRLLNVQLATRAARPGPQRSASAASFFTGSSGKTATTGVKGLDEEDIKNASPDHAELARLATLAVPADEARANAQRSGLKETQLAYLKEGRK